MATIHRTTMTPTKLELLEKWLPTQPWYEGERPELSMAGGFRLDDPGGEVGIEFMVVNDASGAAAVSYHVPLTYRGAPLDSADHALVGTSEHGVLGQRWIYDGLYDPVLAAQLLAFFGGRAKPQAQSVSDTPDPAVTADRVAPDVAVNGQLHIVRVLGTDTAEAESDGAVLSEVTADWHLPDGTARRGCFAKLLGTAERTN